MYLWTNRLQFEDVHLRPVPAEPSLIALPGMGGATDDTQPVVVTESKSTKRGRDADDGLVELAGLPKTKWAALASLEAIRVLCGLLLVHEVSDICRNAVNPNNHRRHQRKRHSFFL